MEPHAELAAADRVYALVREALARRDRTSASAYADELAAMLRGGASARSRARGAAKRPAARSACALLSLPPAMIERIGAALPSPEDVLSLAATCRAFHAGRASSLLERMACAHATAFGGALPLRCPGTALLCEVAATRWERLAASLACPRARLADALCRLESQPARAWTCAHSARELLGSGLLPALVGALRAHAGEEGAVLRLLRVLTRVAYGRDEGAREQLFAAGLLPALSLALQCHACGAPAAGASPAATDAGGGAPRVPLATFELLLAALCGDDAESRARRHGLSCAGQYVHVLELELRLCELLAPGAPPPPSERGATAEQQRSDLRGRTPPPSVEAHLDASLMLARVFGGVEAEFFPAFVDVALGRAPALRRSLLLFFRALLGRIGALRDGGARPGRSAALALYGTERVGELANICAHALRAPPDVLGAARALCGGVPAHALVDNMLRPPAPLPPAGLATGPAGGTRLARPSGVGAARGGLDSSSAADSSGAHEAAEWGRAAAADVRGAQRPDCNGGRKWPE